MSFSNAYLRKCTTNNKTLLTDIPWEATGVSSPHWGYSCALCARTVSLPTHFTAYPRQARLNDIYYSPQHVNTTWFVRFQSDATEYRGHYVALQEARSEIWCVCSGAKCNVDATTTPVPFINLRTQTANLSLQPRYHADILRNTLPYFQLAVVGEKKVFGHSLLQWESGFGVF